MVGTYVDLVVSEQLFVQFLTGSKTRENNRNMLSRLGDEPSCYVEDPNGLTHVEDQHFS